MFFSISLFLEKIYLRIWTYFQNFQSYICNDATYLVMNMLEVASLQIVSNNSQKGCRRLLCLVYPMAKDHFED